MPVAVRTRRNIRRMALVQAPTRYGRVPGNAKTIAAALKKSNPIVARSLRVDSERKGKRFITITV